MANGVIHWNADPEIINIAGFSVRYYGLLFAIGLILGYYVVKRIYDKERVPVTALDQLLVYVVVGTLVGARLGHCLFYEPDYFFAHPLEIILPIAKVNGSYKFVGFLGLASHGGAIGVLIAISLYCRKYKVNMLWLLDRMAVAIPISAAFIRFGNFMNSEIYGKPTDGSWGVIFMRDDLVPRHPTQLYEAFSYLFITLVLLYAYKRGFAQKGSGLLFGYFLIMMFAARFIIEFFKENQEVFEDNMPINMGQILSIPFIVAGVLLVVFGQKWFNKPSVETV
jgi:prolipoprotein diacylglyceryl transferase